jgi:hypothetical protein
MCVRRRLEGIGAGYCDLADGLVCTDYGLISWRPALAVVCLFVSPSEYGGSVSSAVSEVTDLRNLAYGYVGWGGGLLR